MNLCMRVYGSHKTCTYTVIYIGVLHRRRAYVACQDSHDLQIHIRFDTEGRPDRISEPSIRPRAALRAPLVRDDPFSARIRYKRSPRARGSAPVLLLLYSNLEKVRTSIILLFVNLQQQRRQRKNRTYIIINFRPSFQVGVDRRL